MVAELRSNYCQHTPEYCQCVAGQGVATPEPPEASPPQLRGLSPMVGASRCVATDKSHNTTQTTIFAISLMQPGQSDKTLSNK